MVKKEKMEVLEDRDVDFGFGYSSLSQNCWFIIMSRMKNSENDFEILKLIYFEKCPSARRSNFCGTLRRTRNIHTQYVVLSHGPGTTLPGNTVVVLYGMVPVPIVTMSSLFF